ncbi:MAG: histidinol-phosphatase HisJ family protein [Ruminococcus sp.]|nr:histidinol-phosphatase HisJ family protein [Ruminococcus sp.]
MNLIDCHTHTQFSVDSEADINECIKRACSLGLAAYAITDHCECNRWYSKEHYPDETTYQYFDFGKDFENSVSAVTKLKEEYAGKIELICGTELGQATHDYEVAERVVSDSRLDFVLGSMHQLPKTEDFCFIDYSEYTLEGIYGLAERYFAEIYKLCKWGKFDVLAHLTYFMRYLKCKAGIDIDISRFDGIIAESFKLLIQNGKGIEINTSGIRQGFGATFPDLKYVKMYRELGGEIVSVGSDSHTVNDIGANVADGAELAKAAGFRYLAYFRQRKPQFINID